MTVYTPVLHDVPTGLDEVGYSLGLPRLSLESAPKYRKRLLAFSRKGKAASESWYASVASILLGFESKQVFTIELVMSGGEPTATDPRVEITSTRLRAWEDYTNSILELDLDLLEEYRFLSDLETAVNASTNFRVVGLNSEDDYKLSKNLRKSNSDGWAGELLSSRRVHVFKNPFIANIYPKADRVFITEVNTVGDLTEYGTYHLDRVNGVLKTYEPMSGQCSYSYWAFPLKIWHDPVKVNSIADSDYKYALQHKGTSDLGVEIPIGVPNDFGATVYNELLRVYPLEWGR